MSLVARTFGTYTLQLFDVGQNSIWIPILGVTLIIGAFHVNISGNKFIEKSSLTMAIIISLVICTVVYLFVAFAVSIVAFALMILIFTGEKWFLKQNNKLSDN